MPDLKPFARSSTDLLQLIIEDEHIGIWELDVGSGRAWRNQTHDEIFGYPELLDEWTYDMFLEHVVEADRARVDERQQSALANKDEWRFQCRIRRADGQQRWISAAGRPIFSPAGEVERLIGHVIDITETKEREARLGLLTEELNHRVRNLLAMIKAMIRLSGSRAKDVGSFVTALEGRVGSLARSHELMIGDNSAGLTPSEILKTELSVFPALRDRAKISCRDEPRLTGSMGQGLTMVFHELITNAIKYGAFSTDTGSVEISISHTDGSATIRWKERGGPTVGEQASAGFGTTLITGAIGSRGAVDLRYPPDGVECVVELDID